MPDSGTTSILGYVSIVPKGAYSPSATYNRLNTVSYNGASYMLIVDTPTTGVTPVDGNTWMQLCSPGEGVTVSAQEVAYVSSTQGTTPPATGWQTTVPEVSAGSYLWSRITTTFSDGSTFNAYMVTRFGIDGSGAVSTVNGVSPDATGNVTLTLGSIATVDNTPTINSQNLVTSGGVYARINAVLSSTQVKIQNGTITLPAASWTGTGPYTQAVTVAGSTAQSQINIQGNQTAIAAANSGGFAVLISNTGGTLTAYAIGTKPTVDLTLQVTIVELSGATGTIVGAPLSGSGVPDGSVTTPKLANGAVTKEKLDPNIDLGSSTTVKLWENASTGSFAAQEVACARSGYQYLAVIAGAIGIVRATPVVVVENTVGKQGDILGFGSNFNYIIGRTFTITEAGINFDDAYYGNAFASSSSVKTQTNSNNIPLEIWGIKGVQ